jgi:hypothetical protein
MSTNSPTNMPPATAIGHKEFFLFVAILSSMEILAIRFGSMWEK